MSKQINKLLSRGKVIFLAHGLGSGGTESFIINAMNSLLGHGYELKMIMAIDEGGKPQFREQEVRNLKVDILYTNDLGGIKRLASHLRKLYNLLKEEQPQVFHANMDLLNGLNLLVAWLAHVPVRVCHSHNSKSQYEAQSGKHFLVSIYRAVMRMLIKLFSNRVCGCSSEAMAYLYGKKWNQRKNSFLIYNGIDIDKYQCNCAKDYHQLITVGRFAAQKNPHFIIDIMKGLKEKRQDFTFLWAGNGDMKPEIETRIRQEKLENNVQLLGTRHDIPDLLRQSGIFIMPSLFEGLPIALIEAQASNCLCLISDTISKQADCGKCVYLPLDADRWVESISESIDGIYDKQINELALSRFDLGNLGKTLIRVYEGKDSR